MNTTLIQLNTFIIFYLREPFFYTKEEIKDFFITKIKNSYKSDILQEKFNEH